MTVRAIKLPRKQSCITRIDPIMSDVRPDADARWPFSRITRSGSALLRSRDASARNTHTHTHIYIYIYRSLISGVEAGDGVAAHRGDRRPFRREVRRRLRGREGRKGRGGRAAWQEAEEAREIAGHSRESRLLRQGRGVADSRSCLDRSILSVLKDCRDSPLIINLSSNLSRARARKRERDLPARCSCKWRYYYSAILLTQAAMRHEKGKDLLRLPDV